MTKVSVLGQEPKKELKKIELLGCVCEDFEEFNEFDDHQSYTKAENYTELILISAKYGKYDAILGKHIDQDDIILYGHWNDGVV